MCVRSCTRNIVLRVDCEFPNYDFAITKGKHSGDCLSFYKASEVSLLDLAVSLLTTTANSFSKTNTQSYLTLVKLTPMAKNELLWWINNPKLCNGQLVIQPQVHVFIQTDASKKGWGTVCRGIRTGGQLSKREHSVHINHLELLAINFAILTLTKMWRMSAIHI